MNFIDRFHDRWADFHPLWRSLAVVLVLGGLAFAVGKPALSVYRGWQVNRQFAAAVEAAEKGRHAEAREFALQILHNAPTRGDTLPILLRATEALGDPLRSQIALEILNSPTPFPVDQRLAAWQTLCLGATSWQVLSTWERLSEAERTNEAFVIALFDRMFFDGRSVFAAEVLEKQPHPLSPPLHLRLMMLLLEKDSAGARENFQQNLLQRISQGSKGVDLLLPLLDRLPQESLMAELYATLESWHNVNDSTPDAAAALRLARCKMAAYPARAGSIFREAFERYRAEDAVATARWCLLLEHPEMALELVGLFPEDDVEAFHLHCRILEEIGDLAAWTVLLESPPPDVFLPEVLCDRAHVAGLAEDRAARSRAEEAALLAALDSPRDDALIRLARHAEFRQQLDFARRAWVEAIRKRSGPLPLGTRLAAVIEHLALMNKESELLDVLTAYRFMEPTNFVFIVQHAYLSSITGRNAPASVIRELTPVLAVEPDLLPARCVLALAYLLEDQPEEALAIIEVEGVRWLEVKPAYRAIRAVSLARNGRADEGRQLMEAFPWDELLPSEARTLRILVDEVDIGTAR